MHLYGVRYEIYTRIVRVLSVKRNYTHLRRPLRELYPDAAVLLQSAHNISISFSIQCRRGMKMEMRQLRRMQFYFTGSQYIILTVI